MSPRDLAQFGHAGICLLFMVALVVIDKLLFKSAWPI